MDSKATLQFVVEKRDALIKLNNKLSKPNNPYLAILTFIAFALSFSFIKSGSSGDIGAGNPIFVIGGTIIMCFLFLYCVSTIYQVITYKYNLDIFDADDLSFIKSSTNLSYHFDKLLETDNGVQYVSGVFKDVVEKALDDIVERVTFLELFEQSKTTKMEMINEVLNSKRFENFKSDNRQF